MTLKPIAVLTASALVISAGSAIGGQEDRRAAMKGIGAAAKAIRNGTDTVANAQKIIDYAKNIPVAFKAQEITGDSTALPSIWENYGDFTRKAGALEQAAMAVLVAANNGGDLGAATKAMFPTCGGCHKVYRVKK